VEKLTMLFICPDTIVGTTIQPNVPPGISKMFVFHLTFFFVMEIFFIFLFLYFFNFLILFNIFLILLFY
jgi:hypothetical protein